MKKILEGIVEQIQLVQCEVKFVFHLCLLSSFVNMNCQHKPKCTCNVIGSVTKYKTRDQVIRFLRRLNNNY